MNTKNNKRRQASCEKIEKAFTQLLQSREISQITVSDICKMTQLNRSTFYANYLDIYDLADKIRDKLQHELNVMYGSDGQIRWGSDYLKLFRHIKLNQDMYNTYFKLGYDSRHIVDFEVLNRENLDFPKEHLHYHVEFHKAGLNAIIKNWLRSGCRESPETMAAIIRDEYTNRH